MFQRNYYRILLLFCALTMCHMLAAQGGTPWRPARFLPSVNEAVDKLQFVAPRLAPYGKNGFNLSNLDLGKLGINFSFTDGSVVSIAYGKNANAFVVQLDTLNMSDPATARRDSCLLCSDGYRGDPITASSCVAVYENVGARLSGRLCSNDASVAEILVDALDTLIVAHGGDIPSRIGASVFPLSKGDIKKSPDSIGVKLASIDLHSPEAEAGLMNGDIIHTVNGVPCKDPDVYKAAAAKASSQAPSGGVLHLEVIRKRGPANVDVHYPFLEVTYDKARIASLRQSVAMTGPDEGRHAASVNPAPAPSSGVHFGFQVRPVIHDDMAPLGLTQARGLVVVGLENGSLADTMGVMAGDVILQVNGAEVGDMQHFSQLIHGATVNTFTVWRKGNTLTLAVPQSM